MKLVFIYGPPAAGKLTVAKELAKSTGFKLYHNHVSVDLAKSVFDFGTPPFWRVVDRVRRDVIQEAAKEGVDVIFTFVYSKGSDDAFVNDIAKIVESDGGKFCPVRLRCNRKELLRRVSAESRRRLGKLSTKSDLNRMLEEYDLASEIPMEKSLSLDTAKLTPEEAAKAIVQYFGIGN